MQQYYAYIYRDPTNNIPFLVGKGTKKRAWDHLKRQDVAVHLTLGTCNETL